MESDNRGQSDEEVSLRDNDSMIAQLDNVNESAAPLGDEAAIPLTLTTLEIDIDTVLTSLKLGRFQYIMLILTGGAYFAACTEVVVFVFLSKPIKEEWNLDDMVFPLLPFCCGIMRMTGSFTFGTLSDKFGRQLPFLCAMCFIAVFGLASAFSPWFWMLVVIRALVTFGTAGIETVNFVLLLGKLTTVFKLRAWINVYFFSVFNQKFLNMQIHISYLISPTSLMFKMHRFMILTFYVVHLDITNIQIKTRKNPVFYE